MRYRVVSDLPEYTVFDDEQGRDLFPTRSGSRNYACRYGCSQETAQMIADALNDVAELRAELALMRRKRAHGCLDARCDQCDNKDILKQKGRPQDA